MSYDLDEIGGISVIGMRVIAFFIGLALLLSGLIDFGVLGETEIIKAMSIGSTATLKFIFGVFLMVLAIIPEAVRMIIEVAIKR